MVKYSMHPRVCRIMHRGMDNMVGTMHQMIGKITGSSKGRVMSGPAVRMGATLEHVLQQILVVPDLQSRHSLPQHQVLLPQVPQILHMTDRTPAKLVLPEEDVDVVVAARVELELELKAVEIRPLGSQRSVV